jgi:hypothetical protein
MDDTDATASLLPDYAAWLERVVATVEAVSYTCRVRLGGGPDAAVAGEAIALRVATGLLARPAVFRHWGLPYSGRIAKLAEAGIADARTGRAVGAGSWPLLHAALASVPHEHQVCFVATCVEGLGDDELVAAWGCDAAAAGTRRARTLAHMKDLALRCGDHRAVVIAAAATTERER